MTHKATPPFSAKEIEDYQKISEEEIAKLLLKKKTEGFDLPGLPGQGNTKDYREAAKEIVENLGLKFVEPVREDKPDLRNIATDFVINETLTKNFSAQNTSRILSEEEATNLLMHEVMAIKNTIDMSNMQPQEEKPLTGFKKMIIEQNNPFTANHVKLDEIDSITGLKLASPETLRDKFTATQKKNKPE